MAGPSSPGLGELNRPAQRHSAPGSTQSPPSAVGQAAVRTAPRADPWRPPHQLGRPHLILPGNGHTARGKLLVEVLVGGLQLYTLNRGELFDVQDILAVNGLGLGGQRQWSDKNTTRAWEGSSVLRITPVLAWLCSAACSSLVWSQKPATHVLLKHGSPFPLRLLPLYKLGIILPHCPVGGA